MGMLLFSFPHSVRGGARYGSGQLLHIMWETRQQRSGATLVRVVSLTCLLVVVSSSLFSITVWVRVLP